AQGLSAAEAAHAAIGETLPSSQAGGTQGAGQASGVTDLATALRESLDALDEPTAQATLDRLLSDLTLETVLRDVLLPYLYDLGERWRLDEITIAQEHFASNVIRGRLGGLARGWGTGHGPRAIIACPPGEQHDLPLMMFGIVLNRRGWRVNFLGASTPVEEMVRVAGQVHPDLVVVSAVSPDRFAEVAADLSGLAKMAPLALAGAGATRRMADELGVRLLPDDPVTAAENEASRR
ncbi:MAG: cobalamin B12-binding domain-containing protein, partial [Ilumatobacteraceae bacterium]